MVDLLIAVGIWAALIAAGFGLIWLLDTWGVLPR
jgi:hypothetical protein